MQSSQNRPKTTSPVTGPGTWHAQAAIRGIKSQLVVSCGDVRIENLSMRQVAVAVPHSLNPIPRY